VYFEYICGKFAGRLLDRVNTPLLIDCLWLISAEGRYLSRLNGAKLVGPKGVSVESDGLGRVALVDNKVFLRMRNYTLSSLHGIVVARLLYAMPA